MFVLPLIAAVLSVQRGSVRHDPDGFQAVLLLAILISNRATYVELPIRLPQSNEDACVGARSSHRTQMIEFVSRKWTSPMWNRVG
jgi:hypothetical protein